RWPDDSMTRSLSHARSPGFSPIGGVDNHAVAADNPAILLVYKVNCSQPGHDGQAQWRWFPRSVLELQHAPSGSGNPSAAIAQKKSIERISGSSRNVLSNKLPGLSAIRRLHNLAFKADSDPFICICKPHPEPGRKIQRILKTSLS